jgi:hypothetical protein
VLFILFGTPIDSEISIQDFSASPLTIDYIGNVSLTAISSPADTVVKRKRTNNDMQNTAQNTKE